MCRRFACGLPFARSLVTKKKRPAFNPRPNQPLIQPEQSGVANSSDSISGNVTKTPKTDRNPHAAKTKLAFTPRPPSTPPPSKKEMQFKPKPPSSPPPRDLQPQLAGPKRTPGLASATAIVLFGSFFTLSVRFWTYVNNCAHISVKYATTLIAQHGKPTHPPHRSGLGYYATTQVKLWILFIEYCLPMLSARSDLAVCTAPPSIGCTCIKFSINRMRLIDIFSTRTHFAYIVCSDLTDARGVINIVYVWIKLSTNHM